MPGGGVVHSGKCLSCLLLAFFYMDISSRSMTPTPPLPDTKNTTSLILIRLLVHCTAQPGGKEIELSSKVSSMQPHHNFALLIHIIVGFSFLSDPGKAGVRSLGPGIWWTTLEAMQVTPADDQILNQCHLVAKFATNASDHDHDL